MALVRSLVHGHHGAVTAQAQPTGGLLVRVTLPAWPGGRECRGERGPVNGAHHRVRQADEGDGGGDGRSR
ncbi:hypothetical protein [Streptomyces noursei]|uniref:hypothetical protein n=1 Tax=Streptomyces noursei TaxID=1971 RepID=UPI003801BC92